MKPMSTVMAVCAVALGLMLCSCRERGDAGGAPERVTLALSSSPDAALAQVACDRGLFRQEGLEVAVRLHRYGKPALQDVVEGRADVATVAETPIMYAALNGAPLSVLATIMTSNSSTAILARKDSRIADIGDLKGKVIGATLGTTSEFFLHSLLITNAISPRDVTIVDVKSEQAPEMLARGEVDAVSAFMPYPTLIKRRLGEKVVAFQDRDLYTECFNLVVTRDYTARHPDTVRKMLRALLKAEEFVRRQPQEAQQIVARYAGVAPDVVREIWAGVNFATVLDQTLILVLEDESEWAIKNGLTKAKKIPNYLDYIYLDGLKSIKPGAVRILK